MFLRLGCIVGQFTAHKLRGLNENMNESISGTTDQIGRMPNLMGDELEEEERRKLNEAGDLLSEMLTPEKGPVKE